MNPFGIHQPCSKIAKNQLIFEQYIIAFNRDKYYIEVQNDASIKCNRLLFYFMQQTFNRLDSLYLRARCLLVDAIMEDQMRKQSASEIEKLNREIKARNKRKELKYKPSPEKPVL